VAGRIITFLLRQFRYEGIGGGRIPFRGKLPVAGRIITFLLRQFRYEGTGGGGISVRGKLLIAILIITLLVGYYVSGMDYINQRQEREALAFQIATVTQALTQMSDPPQNLENLEQWLKAAQERLADEQNIFPRQLNSTEVVSTILELANSLGVNAIPFVTQSWSTEVVGENDYDVLRLTVAAEGNFSQLVNFVSRLENGEYQTLVVEDLTVTRVDAEAEGIVSFIASFDLAIYAQSLNSD
jgi:Tfp pilus assembly protein PilO